MEGEVIGMREERYLTWLPCKVPDAYRNRFKKSGKSELFEWPRGPHKDDQQHWNTKEKSK